MNKTLLKNSTYILRLPCILCTDILLRLLILWSFIIHLSPDSYKVNGTLKKIPLIERLEKLKSKINEIISSIEDEVAKIKTDKNSDITTSKIQCSCLTKKGKRCENTFTTNKERCHLHGNC